MNVVKEPSTRAIRFGALLVLSSVVAAAEEANEEAAGNGRGGLREFDKIRDLGLHFCCGRAQRDTTKG
jgi:hypothetical protein